jgi:xylulokinase
MSDGVIIAHDLGTTGNKASLYDSSGRLIASHYHPYETFYPKPGWVEQRPEDWWQAFVNSTRRVMASANVSPGRIAGISFSGQMMSQIPVGRDGLPLQDNVCIWADHRSQKQADDISRRIGWSNFYNTTGAGMEIAIYPIAKILWLKENHPELYEKTYKFLGAKDIMVNRLTGRFVTDFSEASNTGLLDIHTRQWADDMLEELGIEVGKLAEEMLPSSSVVGKVGSTVSQETGFKEGTPVVLGGGDVACAALGAGVIREGSVYNYIGSASWLAVASSKPILDEQMRPFSLCHVVPEMNVVQLAMFCAGVAYNWFAEQICLLEGAYAGLRDLDTFELMNELAAKSPPGANGLIFLPDMRPGGAPHNNLRTHGALIGLTLAHGRGDILRAVLEGITFNIRLMADAMAKEVDVPFKEMRLIGGGSKSPLWREIEASILNMPVSTFAAQQEANSLGAAIIAGVALGIFTDFGDAVSRFIKVQQTTKPKPENVAVYKQLFPLFNKTYDALVGVNSDLVDFKNGQSAGSS